MSTLKKFIQYYKPYKGVFFLDLLCATFISVVDLLYPQFLRSAINGLFTRGTEAILSALLPIAIGLFIMYVLQSLCKYYISYQGHMMGAHMERDMRAKLFDHYETLSFSYYAQNNSGQMMSKLVSDLFDIAEFAHHGPENLFISLIKIVGSFIFLFMINWQLAIPLSVLVLCMLVFSISQNKRMQATFLDNRRKIGDVNASLQDTLAGIRVVQSFANEDIEREKFAKLFDLPELVEDPSCASLEELARTDAVVEIVEKINKLFLTRTSAEWRAYLTENSVSCEVMHCIRDVSTDEQALANGYVEELEFADGLKVMMPCPPVHFSEYGRRPYAPCGAIGEDTAEVLGGLGYSEADIAQMRESGAAK